MPLLKKRSRRSSRRRSSKRSKKRGSAIRRFRSAHARREVLVDGRKIAVINPNVPHGRPGSSSRLRGTQVYLARDDEGDYSLKSEEEDHVFVGPLSDDEAQELRTKLRHYVAKQEGTRVEDVRYLERSDGTGDLLLCKYDDGSYMIGGLPTNKFEWRDDAIVFEGEKRQIRKVDQRTHEWLKANRAA